LAEFAGELILKIFVYGLHGYFNLSSADFNWNFFDFLIGSIDLWSEATIRGIMPERL
jgi:hypothetical protein